MLPDPRKFFQNFIQKNILQFFSKIISSKTTPYILCEPFKVVNLAI